MFWKGLSNETVENKFPRSEDKNVILDLDENVLHQQHIGQSNIVLLKTGTIILVSSSFFFLKKHNFHYQKRTIQKEGDMKHLHTSKYKKEA